MKRNILKELLTDAYNAWYNDRLSAAEYHHLSDLITSKANQLLQSEVLTEDEWNDIYDENDANLLLVDDVLEL